jgi:hypothetical protein
MTKHDKTAAAHTLGFTMTDGGRMATKHFKRQYAGDCVTRAITLAEGIDYMLVYKELSRRMKRFGRSGANNGVYDMIWRPMLKQAGYKTVTPPGARGDVIVDQYTRWLGVPLASAELPTKGTVVVRVRRRKGRGTHSHHLFTVIDGVIHDSFNPATPSYEYELMEYHIKPRRSALVGQIGGANKPAKPKKERKVTKIEGNGDHIKVGKAWREIDPDGFKRWGKEAGTWSRAAAGAYLQETDPDQYASLLAR